MRIFIFSGPVGLLFVFWTLLLVGGPGNIILEMLVGVGALFLLCFVVMNKVGVSGAKARVFIIQLMLLPFCAGAVVAIDPAPISYQWVYHLLFAAVFFFFLWMHFTLPKGESRKIQSG